MIKKLIPLSLLFLTALAASATPLSSWSPQSQTRTELVEFVENSTNPSHEHFIPLENRIAVFDLDGTLLAELPINFQRMLAVIQLRERAEANPELRSEQPYKAAWEGDAAYYNFKDNHGPIFLEAFAGMSVEQYIAFVREHMNDYEPSMGASFAQLFYQPMLELFNFLQANDFDVYVFSNSEEFCLREFLPVYLNIEPDHIVGNRIASDFICDENGVHFILRPEFVLPENRAGGKSFYVQQWIGRAPVFMAGNTMSDAGLMEWATAANNPHPGLALVIDHDDPQRELQYDFPQLLELAQAEGWSIASMKNDFLTLYEKTSEHLPAQ